MVPNIFYKIDLDIKSTVMKQEISPDVAEVMSAIHYRPAVSIIMPFEPKMSVKAELLEQLKLATDQVEREIRENYTSDLAQLVILKLRNIIKNINFSTFKKSIAIYVSPVFEKVLYLDIAVQQKIIVDESFEIRDLVYTKKEMHKYLVLVLSGRSSKVFIGNTTTFIKIKSNVSYYIPVLENNPPERVANFSDPNQRREVILKKFLYQTDNELKLLLQLYTFPVFVIGVKKVLGYFKDLTKNEKSIVGYIHGNYEDATEEELRQILKPYVNDWKKVKMEDLRNQLEKAADTGRLAVGMRDVWKQASHNRGRLLVVEKNFMYAAEHGGAGDEIYNVEDPVNKFSYIKDAVDDVIEKVLEQGGDVEFVDEGMLSNYQHVALIQYY